MKKVIPYLVIVAVIYLIGAFLSAKFNPITWGEEGRLIYVVACLFVIAKYEDIDA